jgi:nucleolar GTP-binding protein
MSSATPGTSMTCGQPYSLVHKLSRLFIQPQFPAGAAAAARRLGPAPPACRWQAAASAAAAPSSDVDHAPPEEDDIQAFDPAAHDSDEDEELLGAAAAAAALAAAAAAPARAAAPAPPRAGTGAFQRLPMVSPSKELIDSALRRAARTPSNKKLKNEAAKAKNRAARCMDTLMKELAAPLASYERGFPPPQRLHPFEQALLELTVGPGTYERALARVGAVRKASVEVAKGYAARASKAANKKEAVALQIEGFERVEAVFLRGAAGVDELKDVAKSLRRLPVVDPRLPTVALVGAPNVGKSSLVQLLSSGLPEVQNYPFTTRSIKMGHFYVDGRRHQVTDTPGLLNRGDGERNAMERLTLASLQYLPTAVLFVADLTGECGTSVADQWRIRADLRARFAGKPWLDVLSKADLLEEEFDAADEAAGGAAAGEPVFSGEAGPNVVAHSVAFAAAVPSALRVSSLSGGGIDGLKAGMLRMLEEHDLQQQGLEAWGGDGSGGGAPAERPGGPQAAVMSSDGALGY